MNVSKQRIHDKRNKTTKLSKKEQHEQCSDKRRKTSKLSKKKQHEQYMTNMLPSGVHKCPLSGENEDLEYHRRLSQNPRTYDKIQELEIGDAIALFEYYVSIKVFVGKGKKEKAKRKEQYKIAFQLATDTYE